MPDIYHLLEIDSPIHDVFSGFTSPSGLNAWWTLEADGEPKLGSQYRLYFGPEHDWLAEVVHVKPDRELSWSLIWAMDDWMPTTFGFTLSEGNKGTKVSFFHTGWQTSGEHFATTNYCWAHLLNGLKQYLELGIIVPFTERN